MSMFLPDGQNQAPASFAVADSTPSEPETTSSDIALMQRVLAAASRNPNLIPPDFMSYVLDWIQTQRLSIPIGQVFGFSQFAAKLTSSDTTVSTTSTSYTALGGSAPSLTGLSDGSYVILIGARSASDGSVEALIAPRVNSETADSGLDQYAASASAAAPGHVCRASIRTLANGSNTIESVYRVRGGSGGSWDNRWLLALKYAN